MRAYLEAIKILKTEPEYTLKALAQFSRVNDHELLKEAYEYNKNKIPDIPYPLVSADASRHRSAGRSGAQAWQDRREELHQRPVFKKLEEEGFAKKLMGR